MSLPKHLDLFKTVTKQASGFNDLLDELLL
jgi:hypothetical protein